MRRLLLPQYANDELARARHGQCLLSPVAVAGFA
jgi:hypothetical protein